MSDPKRTTLITVGVPKSAKNNVNKTVRLTINLDESNESKYSELNYKELVIAEEKKKRVQNGKTGGLDPFSDNDDDVERVARKFEQKYGGKSTYGRKGRSKQDDFADIGAGYDENDSFIDNTHGYDEMIPPECDTLYGGFYINSGSLEFKTVPQDQARHSDDGLRDNRRNKRRISSSSSEESSESSSESESQEEKDPKTVPNGTLHSHHTEPRKKKNKKSDKAKANKVRRTDSSAANSGKQTSDDNGHVDGESVDSRTSQSDSLTSKPAPSSENPATSDSSRDIEAKTEVKLSASLTDVLQSLESSTERYMQAHPASHARALVSHAEPYLTRLEDTLKQVNADTTTSKAAWIRAARALGLSRTKLLQRIKTMHDKPEPSAKDKTEPPEPPPTNTTNNSTNNSSTNTTNNSTNNTTNNKRKQEQQDDFENLTDEQREAKIVETLARLRDLIEERKPGMLSNYNAECLRVQEERKKLQLAALAEGGAAAERRLPKRRFPWCTTSRALLSRLARLAASPAAAARLLATRALPLFPAGFVRMPTLLRQADLSKEVKASDVKRQRLGSSSHYTLNPVVPANPGPPTNPGLPMPFQEPIQFPSSLTVTTSLKGSPEKAEPEEKFNSKSLFGTIVKTFSLKEDKDEKREDLYVPPNNIGSITITPVPQNQKEKKNSVTEKPGLIRVKSPAALNEMVAKKEVKAVKKPEKPKEKRVESPLHVDTSFQPSKKDPSPKESKKIPSPKDVTQKQIESMKVSENNIPRPALIPVHHSPTFAKPDKRPPEGKRKEEKKKKDVIIVSEIDPLSNEPLNIDDSSSDVELIETDKSDSVVPSKDKNSVMSVPKVKGKDEESDDIDTVMRNIREMEMAHSQEPTKFSNAFSSVITSAKHEMASNRGNYQRNAMFGPRNDEDKFTERPSLNKIDGSNAITG